MIKIDSREKHTLRKYFEKVEHEVTTLQVGDYYIPEKNFCIERKSITDFVGSYISGHLQEQLENMSDNFDKYYLFISGHFNYFAFKKSPYKYVNGKSIAKMKVHLSMTYPNLQILEFDSDKQLCEMVIELTQYEGKTRQTAIIKKDQSTKDIYLSMLTCIRGISVRKAEAIALVYPNLFALIEGVERAEDKLSFLVKEVNSADFKRLKEFFKKNIYL